MQKYLEAKRAYLKLKGGLFYDTTRSTKDEFVKALIGIPWKLVTHTSVASITFQIDLSEAGGVYTWSEVFQEAQRRNRDAQDLTTPMPVETFNRTFLVKLQVVSSSDDEPLMWFESGDETLKSKDIVPVASIEQEVAIQQLLWETGLNKGEPYVPSIFEALYVDKKDAKYLLNKLWNEVPIIHEYLEDLYVALIQPENDIALIFMEYAGNYKTLWNFLSGNQANLATAMALHGLSRLHSDGYIHGDFHASNVMINLDRPMYGILPGSVLLIDFGRTFQSDRIKSMEFSPVNEIQAYTKYRDAPVYNWLRRFSLRHLYDEINRKYQQKVARLTSRTSLDTISEQFPQLLRFDGIIKRISLCQTDCDIMPSTLLEGTNLVERCILDKYILYKRILIGSEVLNVYSLSVPKANLVATDFLSGNIIFRRQTESSIKLNIKKRELMRKIQEICEQNQTWFKQRFNARKGKKEIVIYEDGRVVGEPNSRILDVVSSIKVFLSMQGLNNEFKKLLLKERGTGEMASYFIDIVFHEESETDYLLRVQVLLTWLMVLSNQQENVLFNLQNIQPLSLFEECLRNDMFESFVMVATSLPISDSSPQLILLTRRFNHDINPIPPHPSLLGQTMSYTTLGLTFNNVQGVLHNHRESRKICTEEIIPWFSGEEHKVLLGDFNIQLSDEDIRSLVDEFRSQNIQVELKRNPVKIRSALGTYSGIVTNC